MLLLILTILIVMVVYFVYRKISILNYLKSKPEVKPEKIPEKETELKKDEFQERIKRIQDKLNE